MLPHRETVGKRGRYARMAAWPIQGMSRQWVFDCMQ